MKFITLTTDFGEKDYSAGAVKGAIYNLVPDARIVDISHSITPFDILQTAFVLKNAYVHFPKGSIHIIGVDAERTPEKNHLIMQFDGHFFIGADNGIFHLLTNGSKEADIFLLRESSPICSFPTLNCFTKIAAQITQNIPLEDIGERTETILQMTAFTPDCSADKSKIYGKIIYIDHYGNVISNISKTMFDEIGKNRSFEVIFNSYSFKKIYPSYSSITNFNLPKEYRDFPDGKHFLLFNSIGLLELAIYKSNIETVGGASTLLGLNYLDQVSIHFK